jgi:flagella basal body P-ring formation protein FlgA
MKRMSGIRRRAVDCLLQAWGLALVSTTLALPLARAANTPHSVVTEHVSRFVEHQTRGLPGQVSWTVAPLDERVRLAPCDEFSVGLPPGGRLWGRSTVSVRCLQPQPWQIFVSVTVRIVAEVVVAARPLSAGTVIAREDVSLRTEDLGALPPSVLIDLSQAVGRPLAMGVAGGAALRADQLRQAWAVTQGQTVRVSFDSGALRVSAEGRALGNALAGQQVDVRMASGKTVRGTVRPDGSVQVQ